MEKDIVFETAERYVTQTGLSVFLTGKAGTGKTTFLKYITSTTSKRFVVLAPTGVAAINAGGTTIHSFFQLPLCPYLPDVKELVTEYQMPEKFRSLRKERIKIIRTLELLIIDEISMVRADLLDAVDASLRRYRRNDKPFGGVQLLMIGDAQQLSPVVRDNEKTYISQVYKSPYFFHSKALQKLPYTTIELTKVYRQKDRDFLDILNAIRENRITRDIMDKLNSRVGAFDGNDGGEIIRLTTHNFQADMINSSKLEQIDGKPFEWEAEIEGDFPENLYPVDKTLILKVGAQVMFVRNDNEAGYYNGKIGTVSSISSSGIVSVMDSDGRTIDVDKAEWCNSQYALDKESGEIRQETTGTFKQIPLRIAWAITVHKSQGLTFDKVIINASAAFAFGQVYVALSRCRTLEGISLETPIKGSVVYSDVFVADFNRQIPSPQQVRDNLKHQERVYLFDTLRELFDFDRCRKTAFWIRKILHGKLGKSYPVEAGRIAMTASKLEQLQKTGDTFRSQITQIQNMAMPDDSFLNERLEKAAAYFLPQFTLAKETVLEVSSIHVDNKETKTELKDACTECLTCLETIIDSLESIRMNDFSIDRYHKIKNGVILAEGKEKGKIKKSRLKKIVKVEGEQGAMNGNLREELMQWRSMRFKADNVPAYTILHQSTLLEIAMRIPKTSAELLAIKGMGEAKVKKYGEEILEICKKY